MVTCNGCPADLPFDIMDNPLLEPLDDEVRSVMSLVSVAIKANNLAA